MSVKYILKACIGLLKYIVLFTQVLLYTVVLITTFLWVFLPGTAYFAYLCAGREKYKK